MIYKCHEGTAITGCPIILHIYLHTFYTLEWLYFLFILYEFIYYQRVVVLIVVVGVELVVRVIGPKIYYCSFSAEVGLYIYAVLFKFMYLIRPVNIVAHIVLEYIMYK